MAAAPALFSRIATLPDPEHGLPGLALEICALFNAERLSIYAVSEDGATLTAKVKLGLSAFRELKLPVTEHSIAGFVAQTRKPLNIQDAYDRSELARISPSLRFLNTVDRRTGYRTRQVLAAPIVDERERLLGVVQLINTRAAVPFPAAAEVIVRELTRSLAKTLGRHARPATLVKSRFDDLVPKGTISGPDMDNARAAARARNVDLGDILADQYKIPLDALGASLAAFFGVPYEPFRTDRIKPADLLRNLRREFADANKWVPVEETEEGLLILATDPERVKSSNVVTHVFPSARVSYRVTTAQEFRSTLDQFFGEPGASAMAELLDDPDAGAIDAESPEDVAAAAAAADNEVVKLVNKIIMDAYQQGASDIHIEPAPGKAKTLIRLRKDGTLQPYIEVPSSYRAPLVTRIKIMCDLDISERRKPQDGKIKFKRFGPADIELRVATIPSAGGMEDVVMRILAAGEPLPLEKLGLLPHTLQRLGPAIEKPYGLFFVCGPTGSGKTTTLHSILSHLNKPETKIWTAEDPVEITQKGLRQVQVNRKAGLDFVAVMRAFLRADPDIIMVGEMRDKETVSLGIEASLTGHLVLSTLHTNSAPESVTRLIDMGMDPFNFADALLGILAQRLAKRLCASCSEPYEPAPLDVNHFVDEYCGELENTASFLRDRDSARKAVMDGFYTRYAQNGRLVMRRAVGCKECGNSGYRGRIGLHELMIGSDPVKKLIQERARVANILAQALEDGMRTLKMDGMEKVLCGITDMKQVRSVCIK